jgi:DNA repair protein RadC
MTMQENFEFIQRTHTQGLLPMDIEQTDPILHQKKRNYIITTQYAYSIKTSRVKEPDFPYDGRQITCTSELLAFARSLRDSDIEKMLALYLDAQNRVMCIQIVTGTVNQAVVYPREIIRHALLVGSSAIVLMHNHPSGHTKPSDADILLTKTIREAAHFLDIVVHDHIIIGSENRFFSFREEGLMS